MTLFNDLYRIESARLKAWNYSSSGWYFVTICTHKHELRFGEIISGEMKLSEIGEIAQDELLKTAIIRQNIELDEWVIMPNHVHAIIIINDKQTDGVETPRWGVLGRKETTQRVVSTLSGNSLGSIIGQFKSKTTKRIRLIGNNIFQWQPRFYDHIIRNERELSIIRKYIKTNLENWEIDRNYR